MICGLMHYYVAFCGSMPKILGVRQARNAHQNNHPVTIGRENSATVRG
jgi:hypothetical protein